MANSCAELSAEIAALRAEIARIPKVDEQKIIQASVAAAENLIVPLIGTIILGQLAPVKAAVAAVETGLAGLAARITAVAGTAGEALTSAGAAAGTAGTALSQAGAALSKLAGLAATLAALAASVATLLILGSRLDALEGQVDSVADQLSTAFGQILGVKNRAERALSTANTAIGNANNAVSAAQRANGTAEKALGTANTAIGDANNAVSAAQRANGTAEKALGTATAARDKATSAYETGAQTIAAAAAGTCQTTRPGGCMSNMANNIANNTNNRIQQGFGNVSNLINGLGIGQLLKDIATINTKLGAQVLGGISGKLNRVSQWLQTDRVLNVLIWANTIHNAYMLSSSLGQTLFSIVDNIAGIFLKDDEASSFSASEIIGRSVDNLAKKALGVSTWEGIKATWKKYNRIYQAAGNIINTVSSMFNSLYSIAEVIGNRISRIGNALRWAGAIADDAYNWMNENNNFSNPIIIKITELNEAADSINMVSGEVLNVKTQGKELKDNQKEFTEAVKSLQEKETKKETTERDKIKTPQVSATDV
ncbi:hypothetical protein [Nostoc sp.]|uniref:hypothetical protein n=1 Tax=Nostoc sp. TaxID=1180 RepID=UPI002FF70D69